MAGECTFWNSFRCWREITLIEHVTAYPRFDPRWRSSAVVDLAEAIMSDLLRHNTLFEQNYPSRMPILADALMNAGCDDDEILQHCRTIERHACTCWVLTLILKR